MTTWYTSDLHLGHANIIRYCQRPVADLDAMHTRLRDAWNARVEPGDTVVVLGDVALGHLDSSLALLADFVGTKVLVPGNHDRCFGDTPKARAAVEQYLAAGFRSVEPAPAPVVLAGQRVQLSHFPYSAAPGPVDRWAAMRPVDTGDWLLHGHTHGTWRQRRRMIDVGIDAWGGRPVSDHELGELIAAGETERSALPWGEHNGGEGPRD